MTTSKEIRFGAALAPHLCEPQRFATKDPRPELPLAVTGNDQLPTIGEAIMWAVCFSAITGLCFSALSA